MVKTPELSGGKKNPQTPNSSGRQRIHESPEDECHNRQAHVEICNNKNCPVNNRKGASYEATMNLQKAKLKKKLSLHLKKHQKREVTKRAQPHH